ncbi:putative membrane protein YqjE [Oxalobacteraceae bacterium GrIS 2.11]
MSISASINRMFSTLVGMLHTRLELVSVELEEELLRFSSYFIYSLIALFCGGVAVSLGIFLIIALYWDDHRVAVLLTMIGLFGAASIVIAAWLRKQILNKPRLLQQSIAELKKDAELIRVGQSDSEQEQS